VNFDHDQEAAIAAACDPTNKLVVITGPAGTGKTSIIKEIGERCFGRIHLMAPTGKAAARLKEATDLPAGTIHRELLWDGSEVRRKANFVFPVVIDEASMIDSWLFAKIISFNPPKLVLVGDSDQLPPVGKGQPFHDLIDIRPEIVCHLTKCYRASEAIHIACMDVRNKRPPARNIKSAAENWCMIETGSAEKSTSKLLEWIEGGLYNPAKDVILACRYGAGNVEDADGGIDQLNSAVRKLINPGAGDPNEFAAGDRVICCKNFGPEDLWNGDIGTVQAITDGGKMEVTLDRGNEFRTVAKAAKKDFKLAYALSVHKSQGSQFRRVFFLVLHRHKMMLTRQLVYTAITRAKAGVCVFGELSAFDHSISVSSHKTTILQSLAIS